MTTLAHVRSDTLPENANYRDEGCDLFASCLACPLPVCKFDDPGWMRRETRRERDRAVLAARRREGLSVSALAARFNVSARTIHRILQSGRDNGETPRDSEAARRVLAFNRRSPFKHPTPLPSLWPPQSANSFGPARASRRAGAARAFSFR